MSTFEIISIVVAVVVPLGSAAAWLIAKGFNHQDDIGKQRHDSIERRLSEIETKLKENGFEIRQVETSTSTFKAEFRVVISKLDEMMKELKDSVKSTESNLRAFEKSTVHWLTEELAIIKGRKKP